MKLPVINEPSLQEWNDDNVVDTFGKPRLLQTRDCTRGKCRLYIYERLPVEGLMTPVVAKRYLYVAPEEEENYNSVDNGWEGCVFLYREQNSESIVISKIPQEEIYQMMLLFASGIALMPRSEDSCPHIRNVLILGLGTGLLPKGYLWLHSDVNVKAIEIEPAMVDVAQSMFGLPKDDRLEIVVKDAKKYIRRHRLDKENGRNRPTTDYDIAFMDITSSGTEKYPSWCETKKTLETISWLLNSNGVFVSNVMMMSGQAPRVEKSLVKYFTKVWKLVESDATNTIFFCVNNNPVSELETLSNWLPDNYPRWLVDRLTDWGPRVQMIK